MTVLVDTTIWSLALRRRPRHLSERETAWVEACAGLIRSGEAVLIHPIRQETLCGLRHRHTFLTLRARLASFRYLEIEPGDYDEAAEFFNACRSQGIAATSVDMLICAVASRHEVPIFTADRDFEHYSKVLPIQLHTVA